jgi:hypothetical protein
MRIRRSETHTNRSEPALPCSVAPDPTDLDLAVNNLVKEELAPYGEQVAAVDLTWGEKAGMWFTEVRPANPGSATISVAVDDPKTITATVGHIWLEMFGPATANLPGCAR